jgi:large subunit ribosomal protein L17
MKNKIRKNQLGRKASHKKAMLRNMANSLIKYERIKTTKAKAKELRMFLEPIITRAKIDTLHNRRIVFSRLRSKESIEKLFTILGPKFEKRNGGYTRRYLLGRRSTDSAEMALIEFVGEEQVVDKKEKKQKEKKQKETTKK